MDDRKPTQTRRGFTLVELLVVIGIIAVLISVLLPTLASARKAGYKAKCLANLKTLGDAYKMYQLDNKGWWTPSWQQYTRTIPPGTVGGTADKRWHDFIGKYVVGGMIGKQELNWNGTQLGSIEPQLWTEPVWHSDNALWGCPMWERIFRDSAGNVVNVDSGLAQYTCGYLQNKYPFAPRLTPVAESLNATSPNPGGHFKYTQWSRQSERALIFESISHNWSMPGVTTWPFAPEKPGGTVWPRTPDVNFPIDFNRHGRNRIANKPTDPSLNMLFCDGHAETVSARQAWKAIRMD
ncbi:MAG: hypothetical protein QOF78_571 [Phycisphaerales bacterium]|jgi:prepilin-type N-terminal cleavage/methylation domain-containing protein/prepilin-type processing-associated H-X9-DG protein|nr:hypothetical protein [Phycisphaerales bacterium]